MSKMHFKLIDMLEVDLIHIKLITNPKTCFVGDKQILLIILYYICLSYSHDQLNNIIFTPTSSPHISIITIRVHTFVY